MKTQQEFEQKINELIELYNVIIEQLFIEIETDIATNPDKNISELRMIVRNKRAMTMPLLPKVKPITPELPAPDKN